jgi:hypothetical protein
MLLLSRSAVLDNAKNFHIADGVIKNRYPKG